MTDVLHCSRCGLRMQAPGAGHCPACGEAWREVVEFLDQLKLGWLKNNGRKAAGMA